MKNKKVLFVDDNKFFKKQYKEKLINKGMNFLEASTKGDAVRLIDKENPDIIITELILQESEGFKLLKEIKEKELNIPVVVFTKLSQETDRKNAKDLGAVGYFVKKEANIADVIKKIEEILGDK